VPAGISLLGDIDIDVLIIPLWCTSLGDTLDILKYQIKAGEKFRIRKTPFVRLSITIEVYNSY
jgi:hypothetical protein